MKNSFHVKNQFKKCLQCSYGTHLTRVLYKSEKKLHHTNETQPPAQIELLGSPVSLLRKKSIFMGTLRDSPLQSIIILFYIHKCRIHIQLPTTLVACNSEPKSDGFWQCKKISVQKEVDWKSFTAIWSGWIDECRGSVWRLVWNIKLKGLERNVNRKEHVW